MLHSIDQYLVIDIPEQLIGYIFKGRVKEERTGSLKRDWYVAPTLVTNYQSTVRNIPEDRRSRLKIIFETVLIHWILDYLKQVICRPFPCHGAV